MKTKETKKVRFRFWPNQARGSVGDGVGNVKKFEFVDDYIACRTFKKVFVGFPSPTVKTAPVREARDNVLHKSSMSPCPVQVKEETLTRTFWEGMMKVNG
jgi:hypothetical protein